MKQTLLAIYLMSIFVQSNAMYTGCNDHSQLKMTQENMRLFLHDQITPQISECDTNDRYSVRITNTKYYFSVAKDYQYSKHITEEKKFWSAAKLDAQGEIYLTCAHGVTNIIDEQEFIGSDTFSITDNRHMKFEQLYDGFGNGFSEEYKRAKCYFNKQIIGLNKYSDSIICDYRIDTRNMYIRTDARARQNIALGVNDTVTMFLSPKSVLPVDIALFYTNIPCASYQLEVQPLRLIRSDDFHNLASDKLLNRKTFNVEVHGFPICNPTHECKFSVECEFQSKWLVSTKKATDTFLNNLHGMSGGQCFIVDTVNGQTQRTLIGVMSGVKMSHVYIQVTPLALIEYVQKYNKELAQSNAQSTFPS